MPEILHDAGDDLHHDLGQAVEDVVHGGGDGADALILGHLHEGQAEAEDQGEEDDLEHGLVDQGLKDAGGDDVGDDVPDVGLGGLAGGVGSQLGDGGHLGMGAEDVAHQEADDDAESRGDQVDDDHADTDLAHVSGRDGGRADHQGADDHGDDDHLQQPGEDGAEHADPLGQGRDAGGGQDDARDRADDEADEDLVQYVEVQVCPQDTALLGFVVCHRYPS